MIRSAVYLACGLMLVSAHAGFAREDLFDTSKPIVEIEWRGQANMGQGESLDLIGIQIEDTLQRGTVRRSLERLYLNSKVIIQVKIAEGERTWVRSLAMSGPQAAVEAELRLQLTMQVGDPFDEVQAQDDLDRLLAVYERRGYRDGRLTLDTRFEDGGRSVHLTYHIEEGSPTWVGDIIIQGNSAPWLRSSPVS